MRRALPFLILSILFAPQLRAADLTKIERTIRKEPAYQSKTPRYCLLVFGPDAQTRIWLVLDGSTLYVDRNGNGDLTEEGEKIAATKGVDFLNEEIFEVAEIRDGARTHKNLTITFRKVDLIVARDESLQPDIARLPDGRGCTIRAEIDMPGSEGKGIGGRFLQSAGYSDTRGFLAFADKPQDAPIVYFGGPWQMQMERRNRLLAGQETDLVLYVGTPGLGAGTTVNLYYPGAVPENVSPRIEITYPPMKPGEPPLKRLYELKERC